MTYDPKTHWRYRHRVLHRLERFANYWWEYVTWGPLYFVRRAICWAVGHADDFYDLGWGHSEWFCRRCMAHK